MSVAPVGPGEVIFAADLLGLTILPLQPRHKSFIGGTRFLFQVRLVVLAIVEGAVRLAAIRLPGRSVPIGTDRRPIRDERVGMRSFTWRSRPESTEGRTVDGSGFAVGLAATTGLPLRCRDLYQAHSGVEHQFGQRVALGPCPRESCLKIVPP